MSPTTSKSPARRQLFVTTDVAVQLPLPFNFLQIALSPEDLGDDRTSTDVGRLSDGEAEKVGEAIKRSFIDNVKKRRAQLAEKRT